MSVRDQARNRGWLGWAAQVLLLLFAAYVAATQWALIPGDMGLRDRGSRGGTVDYPAPGVARVRSIRPGGALDKAGIVLGDRLHYAHPYEAFRQPGVGESVPIVLEHQGQSRPFVLKVPPGNRNALPWDRLAYEFASISSLLFGVFIILRSRRQTPLLLLGGGLAAFGMIGIAPPSAFPEALFPYLQTFNVVGFSSVPIVFYAFALAFHRSHVGRLHKASAALFWFYAAVGWSLAGWAADQRLRTGTNTAQYMEFWGFVGFALCLGYLALGWRRSALKERRQYTLLLIATGAIVLCQTFDNASAIVSMAPGTAMGTAHDLINAALTFAACGLYAYSIFRHKVIDLGFAVNRTLVYGVVSAVLLVAFGLIEWASEHFIPIEAREKNVLVDAGIALGVFLGFHRLRDWVEEGIERLFFHHWHAREAALRRFVADAAYVLKSKALQQGFVQALSRFAEGAPTALYMRTHDGLYERLEAFGPDAPAEIDADHPAVVALRSRRKAADGEDLVSLDGFGLALPMMARAEVMGFALVGAKASGLAFRPDEVEVLAWAAHQVGLDLYALKIEQIEAQAAADRAAATLGARDGLRVVPA